MRIAIIGGGVAGLTAAWELARSAPQRAAAGSPLHVALFESSNRLGGIIQTVHEGDFLMETGPDAWLTAKPWASELARDLGLADELIPSNDAVRKTWLFHNQSLLPIPDGFTLMVPSDLDTLTHSPLFTPAAIAAYRSEPSRAAELLATVPPHDESVASFTLRHFGPEILHRVAAPLLSGIFGGNVHTLSARAALPALVRMERTHGSLITALQAQRSQGSQTSGQHLSDSPALFTTLRAGLGTLIDSLIAQIPPHWLHLNTTVTALSPAHAAHNPPHGTQGWLLTHIRAGRTTTEAFDRVLLALPAHCAARLLAAYDPQAAALLPTESSSAVLVALAFPDASRVAIPPGFGILVAAVSPGSESPSPALSSNTPQTPTLLQACTFADQKFPGRVPPGGRLLRAYFGGASAARLGSCNNDEIAAIARLELARILQAYTHPATRLSGPAPTPLPEPLVTVVRRLPHSLPQYNVGHLDRVAELRSLLASSSPGLFVLGNSLDGLGIPDVIRDARQAAKDAAC